MQTLDIQLRSRMSESTELLALKPNKEQTRRCALKQNEGLNDCSEFLYHNANHGHKTPEPTNPLGWSSALCEEIVKFAVERKALICRSVAGLAQAYFAIRCTKNTAWLIMTERFLNRFACRKRGRELIAHHISSLTVWGTNKTAVWVLGQLSKLAKLCSRINCSQISSTCYPRSRRFNISSLEEFNLSKPERPTNSSSQNIPTYQ